MTMSLQLFSNLWRCSDNCQGCDSLGNGITFNDAVDGSSNLTVNAVSGNIAFNGAVGAESALGNLTANSTRNNRI
jgi:uncharacterized protein (DUF983 family)